MRTLKQTKKTEKLIVPAKNAGHYKMPDKKSFLLDIAIGRYFHNIGDFKTPKQIMRFFKITPEKFVEGARIVARVLDEHERREIKRVLLGIGWDTAARKKCERG